MLGGVAASSLAGVKSTISSIGASLHRERMDSRRSSVVQSLYVE